MSKIRYTIAIPTADRAEILQHTLKSLSNISKRPDIQIIVSNNASIDKTEKVINNFKYVDYIKFSERLDIPAHWDAITNYIKGDYFILLGDDDYLFDHLFSKLDYLIDKFKTDLITWDVGLYHHPDFDLHNNPNHLIFAAGHSNKIFELNPKEEINLFFNKNYRFLPEGLRFCVSNKLIKLIKKRTGKFFWQPYPDFATPLFCLAELATIKKNFFYIDSFDGLGGRSKYSNAAGYCENKKIKGNSKRVKEYYEEMFKGNPYPHHKLKVPFFFNGHFCAISVMKYYYPGFTDLKVNYDEYHLSFLRELFGIFYNPINLNNYLFDICKYFIGIPFLQKLSLIKSIIKLFLKKVFRYFNLFFYLRKLISIFLPYPLKSFLKKLINNNSHSKLEESYLQRKMVTINLQNNDIYNGSQLHSKINFYIKNYDFETDFAIKEAERYNLLVNVHKLDE